MIVTFIVDLEARFANSLLVVHAAPLLRLIVELVSSNRSI